MKLHVVGASGAGTTTLGTALAQRLAVAYLDTDAFFWMPTTPPFTARQLASVRNEQLRQATTENSSWVIGGSLHQWDLCPPLQFDLVIFLWLPPAIRLQRLAAREYARYGSSLFTDPVRNAHFQSFMAWAAGYDAGPLSGRTLRSHEHWLTSLRCPVLELRGDYSVAERLAAVEQEVRRLHLEPSGPRPAQR